MVVVADLVLLLKLEFPNRTENRDRANKAGLYVGSSLLGLHLVRRRERVRIRGDSAIEEHDSLGS